MSESTIMNVGGWTVLPEQNLLQRDGQSIKLEPRAIELLVYLARRPGKVVTAQDLMADVWRGRIVEDSAIYKRINELRKAFGDDAREPRFIETIPKRGYRLVAKVEFLEQGVSPTSGAPQDPTDSEQAENRPVSRTPGAASSARPGNPKERLAYALLGLSAIAVGAWTVSQRGTAIRGAPPRIIQLTTDGGVKERPRLSSDGKLVAFAWNGGGNNNFDIYVKATETNARVINMTEHPAGDGAPAWSHDSTQLAFVRNENGRLSIHVASWPGREPRKIIDVAGAPVFANHRIATLSWSPDDTFIAYAERPVDAPARIMRVDPSTGKASVLTMPPPGADVIGDFDPSYSPDGKWLAFVRAPTASSNLDIWIIDAEGRDPPRRVTEGRWAHVHSLAWRPDGKEVLFTAGELFSQRGYSVSIDEGTPYPLPGLGDNDRFANAQGERLVYARYAMAPLRIWRTPGRNAIVSEARDFGLDAAKLAFTQNGERIAYIRGGNGHVQIWTAKADGSDQKLLVEVDSDAFDPEWSPDGKQLLFVAVDGQNWDVHAVDVDAKREREITKNAAHDQYPSFSRDGDWIYFSSNRTGQYEVYKVPARGGDSEAVQVTRGGGLAGVESYDGRYLFYELNQNGDPAALGDGPILRMELDGGEVATVLESWGPRPEKSWVLVENGIYFLVRGPPFVVRYLDLATLQKMDIFQGTGSALYPTVLPGEESVFVAKEPQRTSELWLVENFIH